MKDNRTYADRRRYNIDYVIKRRKLIRLKAVQHLGGKCSKCGYSKCKEALEFHHKIPSQKEFSIALKGHCRSWERVRAEIEKCDLLCANCHRELHAEIDKLTAKNNPNNNSYNN